MPQRKRLYAALNSPLFRPIYGLFSNIAREMYPNLESANIEVAFSRLKSLSEKLKVEYWELESAFKHYFQGLTGGNKNPKEIDKEFNRIVKETHPEIPEEPGLGTLRLHLKEVSKKFHIDSNEMEWRFWFFYTGLLDKKWLDKYRPFLSLSDSNL